MTTGQHFYGKQPMTDGLHGSYLPTDVEFLLTALNKQDIKSTDPAEKEALIQSGQKHYSQMLTLEKPVSAQHFALYQQALARHGGRMAGDIHALAQTLFDVFASTDKPLILVSLVRAGVPIGVLLKRAFADDSSSYHRPAFHYGVSIIRDKGIDELALLTITQKHPDCPIVFVDGWTGKGAIFGELTHSLQNFTQKYPHTHAQFHHQGNNIPLVVLADPAGVAWLSAGDDDWLMPSSLLNSTISGLISRTLYRDEGFHGCVYYDEFLDIDQSLIFVNMIDTLRQAIKIPAKTLPLYTKPRFCTKALIDKLANDYAIDNDNRIKPTIAEATRAVLRRQPECVLLGEYNEDTQLLQHLCQEKKVPISIEDIHPYQAITLIKKRS